MHETKFTQINRKLHLMIRGIFDAFQSKRACVNPEPGGGSTGDDVMGCFSLFMIELLSKEAKPTSTYRFEPVTVYILLQH